MRSAVEVYEATKMFTGTFLFCEIAQRLQTASSMYPCDMGEGGLPGISDEAELHS